MVQRQATLDRLDIGRGSPHPARMYDYVLGGQTHFAADRELTDKMGDALPGGLEFIQILAQRNRAFMARVVRYLASEAGMRQYLDVGSGIPAYDNTHEIAQAVAPESRVAYVDYDPIVLAHAHERLGPTEQRTCDYIHADFRDPDEIVERAAATLDFDRPVALMLIAILHLIDEDRDPYGVVSRLIDAVPSGSYVAISHFTPDRFGDEMARMASIYNQGGETLVLRTHDEVLRFFDGLDLVDPGVVLIEDWRPDSNDVAAPSADHPVSLYGGVALKP